MSMRTAASEVAQHGKHSPHRWASHGHTSPFVPCMAYRQAAPVRRDRRRSDQRYPTHRRYPLLVGDRCSSAVHDPETELTSLRRTWPADTWTQRQSDAPAMCRVARRKGLREQVTSDKPRILSVVPARGCRAWDSAFNGISRVLLRCSRMRWTEHIGEKQCMPDVVGLAGEMRYVRVQFAASAGGRDLLGWMGSPMGSLVMTHMPLPPGAAFPMPQHEDGAPSIVELLLNAWLESGTSRAGLASKKLPGTESARRRCVARV